MPEVRVNVHIAAPQERVFQAFSDFSNAPGRIAGIKRLELLTPGPVGKGTRFRETRVMFGKEATETMEVTEFRPSDSYTLECDSCGAHYLSRFNFTPHAGGTRVEMTFSAKAMTLLAKLFSPLSFLMIGGIRKCVEQDMQDIKKFVESGRA